MTDTFLLWLMSMGSFLLPLAFIYLLELMDSRDRRERKR